MKKHLEKFYKLYLWPIKELLEEFYISFLWPLLKCLVAILILLAIIFLGRRSLNFNMEEWGLLENYLKVVLSSWPIVILVIVLQFMFRFHEPISSFIRNIKEIGKNGVKTWQREEEDHALDKLKHIQATSEKNSQDEVESQKIINTLKNKAELYEFAYLDYFLVGHTKIALLGFRYYSPTEEDFLKGSGSFVNGINLSEKKAIFNALLSHELIQQNTNKEVYEISEKGERFLKYSDFEPQFINTFSKVLAERGKEWSLKK